MTVTAAGGTITAIDSADYTEGGTLTINRPVTIDGGAHGAFVSGPPAGYTIVINLNGGSFGNSAVVLRNLSVLPGFGISAGINATISAGSLKLENVSVNLADTSDGVTGMLITLDSLANASLKNVTVFAGNNFKNGPIDQECIDVVLQNGQTLPFNLILDHVTTDGCQSGLLVLDGNATIKNSSFNGAVTGIQFIGIELAANWLVENTEIVNNSFVGIDTAGGGTLRLGNSVISGNLTGVRVEVGTTAISYRNNTFAANGTDGTLSLTTSLK